MTKFTVGDRVRIKRFRTTPDNWNSEGKMNHLMGKVVEIVGVWNDGSTYRIYDEQYSQSWCLHDTQIEPVNEVIVVYRKGNRVIALDKSTGNKAEARCCSEDTFNFETGAKIAFGKLFAEPLFEPKPTYYNGKIIFTKGDTIFKTGHIYEIKDGNLKHPRDSHALLPSFNDYNKFYSIEDVKDYFTAEAKLHDGEGWSCKTLEFIEVLND